MGKAGRNAKRPARQRKPAPGPVPSWWRVAFGGLTGALAYFFLFGYAQPAPMLLAPVLAGLVVAVLVPSVVRAPIAAAAGAVVAAPLSAWMYTMDVYVPSAQKMPAFALLDLLPKYVFAGFLTPLMEANGLNTPSGPGPVVIVALALTVTPAVAWAGALAVEKARARLPAIRDLLGWFAVAGIVGAFVWTGFTQSAYLRDALDFERPDGNYRYDGTVYERTYQKMLRGGGYYESLISAAAGDSRLQEWKSVRGGKFYGWIGTPTLAREPWASYVWRLVAPRGAVGVFEAAVLLSAAVMVSLYWGMRERFGHDGLLAAVMLYPLLLLLTVWLNIFMPDYWAGLTMVISLAFLLRGRFVTAGAFALAAALFRETLVFWLFAVLIAGILGRGTVKRPAAVIGSLSAMVVAFTALYGLHYIDAARMISPDAVSENSFIGRLVVSAEQPLVERIAAPAAYAMWAYGYYAVPGWVFLPAGIAGAFLGLRGERRLEWTVAGYGALWLLFYLTIGATAAYWGQQVMPFYLACTAMLLSWASRLGTDTDPPQPSRPLREWLTA